MSVNIDLVSKIKYNRFIPLSFNSYNIRTTGQRCGVCTLSFSYYVMIGTSRIQHGKGLRVTMTRSAMPK